MRKFIRILIGVLAVATICLGLGWATVQLGKLYIAVIGSHTKIADNLPAPEAKEKKLIKLPDFEVYYLQLGVFQEQQNADKLANELQWSGVKAVVLRGQPNKVAVGYFGNLSAAKAECKLQQNVKPIEKSLTVHGLAFKAAPGDAQKLGTLLSQYAALLDKVGTVCSSADAAQLKVNDLENLHAVVSALSAYNEQNLHTLTAENSRIPGKPVLAAMQAESNNIRQNLQLLLQTRNRENYSRLQESTLRLVDLYQEYLNLLQIKPVN